MQQYNLLKFRIRIGFKLIIVLVIFHFLHSLIFEKPITVKIILKYKKKLVEVPGIEPGTFRMRSGHSTTELHPHRIRPSAI